MSVQLKAGSVNGHRHTWKNYSELIIIADTKEYLSVLAFKEKTNTTYCVCCPLVLSK